MLLFAIGIWIGDQSWISTEAAAGIAVTVLAIAGVKPGRGFWLLGILLAGVAVQSWQTQDTPGQRLSDEPRWAEAIGQVIQEPKPFGTTGEKFRVTLRVRSIEFVSEREWTLPTPLLVIWHGATPPAYGDEIRIRGMLRPISPPRNPGEFNYAAWLHRKGIYSEIEPRSEAECQVISSGQGNPLFRFAIESRHWIGRAITAGLEPSDPATALILAMTLGDTEDVPVSVREDFQLSGTLHVFSVSGLHIAMLAVIVWQVVRLLRLPRGLQCAVVILLIFFYALVTGWSPPSVRAAIMTACFILAMMLGRRPQPFNILAGAALFILLMNPNELFNVGFQLSFIVVAAILLMAMPIQRKLQGAMAPDVWLPRPLYSRAQETQWLAAFHVGSLLAVSLAASLGSVILTGYHFHFISFVAPLVNLVVVPLSFVMLCLATLSMATFGLSQWLAGVFAQTNWVTAIVTIFTVEQAANLPGASMYLGVPILPPSKAQVTVFDAGRGGAVVIQTRSQTVILDSGGEFFFRSAQLTYLRSRGIARVQGLLLSHGDARHVGAAGSVVRELRPEWIGISTIKGRSPTLARFFAESSQPRRIFQPGDEIAMGEGVRLEVLAPRRGTELPLADDVGLVLRLSAGRGSILFTNDLGFRGEEELLTTRPDQLRADVWVKGQHVSGNSGRDSFLAAIAPRAVICTAADFPDKERPSAPWLSFLQKKGIRTFNQAETGAVELNVFEDRIEIRAFLNGDRMEIRQ